MYVDVTLIRSKIKVKVTGLLNFRQLAKPCMLAAMTADGSPLAGLSGYLTGFLCKSYSNTVLNAKTAMANPLVAIGRLQVLRPWPHWPMAIVQLPNGSVDKAVVLVVTHTK